MNSQDLTLLSAGQVCGDDNEEQLEVIKKYGTKAAITDLCILTGSYLYENTDYNIDEDKSLTGRTSDFWTRSNDNIGYVFVVLLLLMRLVPSNSAKSAAMLFVQYLNLLKFFLESHQIEQRDTMEQKRCNMENILKMLLLKICK